MKSSPLSLFRDVTPFMRSTAALVLVTFAGLVLEPTVVAAQTIDDPLKLNTPADPKAPSAEDKLSEAIQTVQDRVERMRDKLAQKQDATQERDELKSLKTQIQQLDTDVENNFNRTLQHLKDKHLPEIILQRHNDAVTQYKKERDALLKNLDDVETATDDDDRKAKIERTKQHLDSKQHQRTQQPFDANDLPRKNLEPTNKKPRKSKTEFTASELYNLPLTQLAALGDFKYDQLPGASDPVYLAETDEIVLTDAIKSKAAELNHDALTIYNWVRNNVEWLPTWGAIQSADHTLGSLKGNSMDIATLLIALYRASGIPARYVHGTLDVPMDKFMNWSGGFTNAEAALRFASSGGIPTEGVLTGGKLATARMEHIWVEAAIDFEPSRGAKNKSADAWIAMDPSFKQYQFTTGVDVAAVTTVNMQTVADQYLASGSVNEQEGWISGFDPTVLQNAQTQMQTELETYLTNQPTPPTVGDVIGGRNTIIQSFKGFPASLPNHVVVKGTTMDKLPGSLQHRITIQLGTVNDLFPNGKVTLPFAKVNNEKVTLSFRPATPNDEQVLLSLLPEGEITDISQLPSSIPGYLINVVPELKVNGQVKATGQPQTLGSDFWLSVTQHFVSRSPKTASAVYPSGSYYALSTVGGSVSTIRFLQLKDRVTNTVSVLDSGDATLINGLTDGDVLGDTFFAGTLGYYAQSLTLTGLMALQQGGHLSLFPSAGTYGYTPKVQFMFGLPTNLQPGGIQMDLFQENVTTQMNDGDLNKRFQFLAQTGVMGSALEHIVPEQMFNDLNDPTQNTEAISAVKALQKAATAGQKIYQITAANKATTLPNIHHDAGTMSDINNALNAGKIVITHTNAVSVPGWTGSGYIILDPAVGDGAYKIGGGMNGGLLKNLKLNVMFLAGWWKSFTKAHPALAKGLLGSVGLIVGMLVRIVTLLSTCKDTGFAVVLAVTSIMWNMGFLYINVLLAGTGVGAGLLFGLTALEMWLENKVMKQLTERC